MTQTYQARIYVTLRPSVLDPAGAAVRSGIEHMGFRNVSDVRIGKYIEVVLAGDSADAAQQEVDQICDRLLANPVIENYRFELVAPPSA
jgi:phosphoribosylformylglycinamidine synthase subunit PurS